MSEVQVTSELRQQVADTIRAAREAYWQSYPDLPTLRDDYYIADAVLALPHLTEAPSLKAALDRLLPGTNGRVFDGAVTYRTAGELYDGLRAGVSQ